MKLYKHNQEAYEASVTAFESGKRYAAIVHATGTGKAYVGGAITNNYGKVLVLAPSDAILAQNARTSKEGCEYHTYAWCGLQDTPPTGYDLIWLDEYHRCGAVVWGDGVKRILDANPQAKVFGTTATDVRYLDNERNMSDELFEGNVVHRLSLQEALARGIFKIKAYIQGMYTMDVMSDEYLERIDSSKKIDENDKEMARKMIDKSRLDWTKAGGVMEIFRKHMPKEAKAIIVFCDRVDNMREMRASVNAWLTDAGFKVGKTYSVSAYDKNSNEIIRDFEYDEVDGLKVMFSINMLNEGVHIGDVDAVVMLRSTTSRIIHLQQMGRCLTAYSEKMPVIFDLVDNMSSSDVVKYLTEEFRENVERLKSRQESYNEDGFNIVDYLMDTREVIAKLDKMFEIHFWTYAECLECAKQCKTYMEFRNRFSRSYGAAVHNGWLEDIIKEGGLIRKHHNCTKEDIIEAARGFRTLAEFDYAFPNMVQYARKYGWIDDLPLTKKRHVWTEEELVSLSKEYSNFSEFAKIHPSAVQAIRRLGIQDKCLTHMNREWRLRSDDDIREAAKQYPNRRAFSKGDSYAYKAACARGLIDELFGLAKSSHTFEECRDAALKYDNKNAFKKNDSLLFNYASKKRWLKEITKHMPYRTHKDKM